MLKPFQLKSVVDGDTYCQHYSTLDRVPDNQGVSKESLSIIKKGQSILMKYYFENPQDTRKKLPGLIKFSMYVYCTQYIFMQKQQALKIEMVEFIHNND